MTLFGGQLLGVSGTKAKMATSEASWLAFMFAISDDDELKAMLTTKVALGKPQNLAFGAVPHIKVS